MHRNWKLAGIPVVLGIVLAACPGPEEVPPGTVKVTVGNRRLDGQGQSTGVYITVVDNQGQAGTGTISLKAKAGVLADTGPEVALPLEGGMASTTFTCDRATTEGCRGSLRIEGNWNDVVGATSVVISPPPDAGTTDGTDGGT